MTRKYALNSATRPKKPYLLFIDTSKHCYSGTHTQASTDESNEALLNLLSNTNPFTSVASQTQDLKFHSDSIHPVAYISGSSMESQCRWLAISKEFFGIFMSTKQCSFYLQNVNFLVQCDHKLLQKIFTGNADNENVTHGV